MRLHETLPNSECIGKVVCAQPDIGQPWVSYEDSSKGEKDYYRDVYVDGFCAYVFGESCTILGYDENRNTITLSNEGARGDPGDDWGRVFTIPYEQYIADFGIYWS